jgi:hypothetical protein
VTYQQSTKIPLSDLATLEQLLDQAPARRANEVSKRRAIGILAPKLEELRRKGYMWRDVAAWLTEHGLTVTVPALQRYLRSAKSAAARGGRGRSPGRRKDAPLGGIGALGESKTCPVDPAISLQRAAKTAPSALPLSPDGTARRPEPEPRRAEFVVRPDSKDL